MTPFDYQFAVHRMLGLAPAERAGEIVRDAAMAVRVEFDDGRVICRDCLLVMETDESEGWQEGHPRCVACWREAVADKADFDHGGEA